MKDLNHNMFLHIDKLRIEKGISIEDFCIDVCNRRQYTRYFSQEQQLSLTKLASFVRKLEMTEIEFYYSYYTDDSSEYLEVEKLYYLLTDGDYKQAKKKLDLWKNKTNLNPQTKRYIEFCNVYYKDLTNMVSKPHSLELYSNLIDLDRIHDKTFYDFIDLAVLRLIAKKEFHLGKFDILNHIRKLLIDRKFIYTNNETRNILPSLYATIVRLYGMLDNHEYVKEISHVAIEFLTTNNAMHNLEEIYYYLSLAYYKTGDINQSYIYASKALATIKVKGNNIKYLEYLRAIENEQKITESELSGYLFNSQS